MTAPAQTVRYFGFYLMVVSAGLMTAPDLLLQALGLPPSTDVWVRVVGLLAGCIGFYYIHAAKLGFTPFFACTVWTRLGVLAVLCVFVAAELAPPAILLLGAMDAAGALWTWIALSQPSRSRA